MVMLDKFVGTWQLKNWEYWLDDISLPLWEDKQGMLIYTANNKMSAILMNGNRKTFKQPFLSKGTVQEKEEAINGYVSYAGSFTIDSEKVYHHVQLSLLPNWIGTTLERWYHFEEEFNILVLRTSPQLAPNGQNIKNILKWQRQ